MITQIIDGGEFDEIRATRIHKVVDGGGCEEVSIKDLTKEELMGIARTYYMALQEMGREIKEFIDNNKIYSRSVKHLSL